MIQVENLKKTYKNFTLDCTLKVLPGCVTGMIGQNGAGKSTTFKTVLGLIKPEGGNITVFDKNVNDLEENDRQRIGVVLSDAGFSGYLRIADIVPIMNALYTRFEKEKFLKYCNQFHLPMNKKVKEFSTGMQAKLKVLVAISHNADLLILDEPTAGLDVVARDELLELLRAFMEEKETHSILISSHISSDLESLCDDLYMIHNGKIILHEETDVLLSNYGLLKVDLEQMKQLDLQYLLKKKRESFGYSCLTNQRQYYQENYPDLTMEKGNIDELIMMMIKGEER